MNEAQLPPGQKWHNPDNLPSAGDPPWRFLVEFELIAKRDEFQLHNGEWSETRDWEYLPHENITYRTRRPLPAIPEPSVPAQGEAKPFLNLPREWYEEKAKIEGNSEVGAGNPSPVAPSGGEECPNCHQPVNDRDEHRVASMNHHFWCESPTSPPAEAPTPRTDAEDMRLRGLYEMHGEIRCNLMTKLARTLERELSAMRQERANLRERINSVSKSRDEYMVQLATVTAEREALRQESENAAEDFAALHDAIPDRFKPLDLSLLGRLELMRDTLTASAESARKDGEAVEKAIQAFEDKERGIPQAHMAAELVKELRARLTSEGGR